MLANLSNVSKYFADRTVFDNVSFTIEDNDRIGLVGENGVGKTTLLNIIAGTLEFDGGEVNCSKNTTIGYLRQKPEFASNHTIYDEMQTAFEELIQIRKKLQSLEQKIAIGKLHLQDEYAKLQNTFENREGYLIDVKIKKILTGMSFGDKDFDTKISKLSGGEKTRLFIAKLLLLEPNLLILDEPTNHLDFKTLLWLENYIQNEYKGAVIVVSHDRYFLDKITTSIYEIEFEKIKQYKGNYSKFLKLKAEQIEYQEKEYEKQQQTISSLETYVQKNIARASTSKSAKSKLKTLEKMEIVQKPKSSRRYAKFDFCIDKEPYKDVLSVRNGLIEVAGNKLMNNLDFGVEKGEKIAIIGANGIGKTTFLKTILGKNPLNIGKMKWGDNVKISYFDQEGKNLDSSKTAIDQIWDKNKYMTELSVRNTLASVLLCGDDVYKITGKLSGGERAKLNFAMIMLERANVLVLDEPTNHLDLTTKEKLEQAFLNYPGTMIFVSHDRYFLNKIPTKIVEFFPDKTIEYVGNYDYYLEKSQENDSIFNEKPLNKPVKTSAQSNHKSKEMRSTIAKIKNRIKAIENELSILEDAKESLEVFMNDSQAYEDYKLMQEKLSELEIIKSKIDMLMNEWCELEEKLEQV